MFRMLLQCGVAAVILLFCGFAYWCTQLIASSRASQLAASVSAPSGFQPPAPIPKYQTEPPAPAATLTVAPPVAAAPAPQSGPRRLQSKPPPLTPNNPFLSVPTKGVLPASSSLRSPTAFSCGEGRPEGDAVEVRDTSTKCDELYGYQGFKKAATMCKPLEGAVAQKVRSELVCYKNEALNSNICEFTNVLVDNNQIHVSRGGEDIEAVLGRSEDAEFPKYAKGAFTMACAQSERHALQYHQTAMADSITYDGIIDNCEWVEIPTLFVTRYEYANLYHTMTDWFNVFQTQKLFSLESSQMHIVFFDGHSKGAIDSVWGTLWPNLAPSVSSVAKDPTGPLPFVKTLPARTCFRRAFMVHAGYGSPLFVNFMHGWTKECAGAIAIKEFASRFLLAHGIRDRGTDAVLTQVGAARVIHESGVGLTKSFSTPRNINILFILRKGYLSHPRIGDRARKPPRTITNGQAVVDSLNEIAVQTRNSAGVPVTVNVRALGAYFEDLSVAEQLMAIRASDVVVGMHGAALSHALFMRSDTTLYELSGGQYSGRFHFEYFSAWAAVRYLRMDVTPSGYDEYSVPITSLVDGLKPPLCRTSRADLLH